MAALPRLTVAVVALALTGGGCGGSTSEQDTASPSKGAKKDEPPVKQLALGDATTLKGLHGAVKVRVARIQDPLPNPATERPKPGRRFVGVHVTLTNVGKERYKDAPLNGSRLVTTVAKGANPTILITGSCPSKHGTSLRLAPGKSWSGCLPFQVKKKAKVRSFQFRLDSGFGPETGEWKAG